MFERHTNLRRRRFIHLVLTGTIAAPVAGLVHASGEKPKLDPASEQAQRLSYTGDAASNGNPARKKEAHCANCAHFHGDADAKWASCNIFPEHLVNANGWCTSWFSAG